MRLDDEIVEHFRLVGRQVQALEKLGIRTIRALLLHVPSRYEDIGNARSVAEVLDGAGNDEMLTLYGELQDLQKTLSWKSKRYMVEGYIADPTGRIRIRWFNQPYLADTLAHVRAIKLTGKLTGSGKARYFANPHIEPLPGLPSLTDTQSEPGLYPIYKTSYGISSKWLYHAIGRVLAEADLSELADPVPSNILERYHLPSLHTALVWAHRPRSARDAEAARKRLSFNAVFYLQLGVAQARTVRHSAPAYTLPQESSIPALTHYKTVSEFINAYPFTLTGAQQSAIDSIVTDMRSGKQMARLLEGDVGSGKTAVAAATAFSTVMADLQVAYMAPTEVLAKQLFNDFVQYFANTHIQIGLLVGGVCMKYPSKTSPTESTRISKAQLTKWLADGTIHIVIGTHALIQKSVSFKKLGLTIIDEQHRFGTAQRAQLTSQSTASTPPHLLSMTATPIPRTLALTIYGDLDLTVIDEMPAGRKRVITKIVPESKMDDVYTHMLNEINSGKQAYVICPRVAPSDLSGKDGEPPSAQKLMMARLKSVEQEVEKLKRVFPTLSIGALHGKMKTKEKDDVMQRFANKEINILVATSVVEVGVNVPDASVILIEGAERFGLSQLHQLRGRVVRSSHQAYCYLATTGKTVAEGTKARLKALTDARNGFELAEKDLELRGAGELRGERQWGQSDAAMDAIKNLKMVEAARTEATRLIREDPTLSRYPALQSAVREHGTIHLE